MARMITIAQAVLETGLCEHTIRAGCNNGEYPAFRVGSSGRGKWMIDAEGLHKLLSEQAQRNIKSSPAQHEEDSNTNVSEAAKGGSGDEVIPFTRFRLVK